MFINQHSIDESRLMDYTLGVGGLNGCLFNLEMAPTERPLFPCFFFIFCFFFFVFYFPIFLVNNQNTCINAPILPNQKQLNLSTSIKYSSSLDKSEIISTLS